MGSPRPSGESAEGVSFEPSVGVDPSAELQAPPRPLERTPLRSGHRSGEHPRKEKAEWLPWFVPTGAFVVACCLTLVFLMQYAMLIRSHYKVVTLRDKQRTLVRERELMELQLQELSSLERVERVATTRLGMMQPVRRQVLDLRKVQSVAGARGGHG